MYVCSPTGFFFFFFFNDTATTEIYTLSLHDALPISSWRGRANTRRPCRCGRRQTRSGYARSEEHTSELQSRLHLVCRLLLEKKKDMILNNSTHSNRLLESTEITLYTTTLLSYTTISY